MFCKAGYTLTAGQRKEQRGGGGGGEREDGKEGRKEGKEVTAMHGWRVRARLQTTIEQLYHS